MGGPFIWKVTIWSLHIVAEQALRTMLEVSMSTNMV